MAQVLIVSNRLPFSVKKERGKLRFTRSVGGLATALSAYVTKRHNQWVGWPGIASEDLTEAEKQLVVSELAKRNCTPIFLSQKQIDDYYNGYSNSLLWPLFHELPYKDSPERARWWRTYREVNTLFAQVTATLARGGGQVWVHDYQLLLVPEMLRAERPDINIGFFLHITFPPAEKLRKLPEQKSLLRGIVGADLVGFHTKAYVKNFLEACERASVETGHLRVADFPIGIDYKKFVRAGRSIKVRQAAHRFRQKYKGLKIIAAVDRLDISKGFVERLVAYRQLLEQNPGLLGKVVFVLVGSPSRTEIGAYQRLAARVQKQADEINATFGTRRWQPVDYIAETIPFEEVTALFQVADVAFITPLRDGMNLTSKEFVASSRQNGVLILSETAGAAEELQDALLVNPKKSASSVAALQKALTMPHPELLDRLAKMQAQLARNTVHHWAGSFVNALQQPVPGSRPRIRTMKGAVEASLVDAYQSSQKRLLLLDYDGSLVPFNENYRAAQPAKSTVRLLKKLSYDPRNEVVIVSGRDSQDLEGWLGHLPIGLIAEHGAMIRKNGSATWQTIEHVNTQWKQVLLPILEKYAALTPGASVETKQHSLVWHYRSAQPYYAQKYAVVIKRALKPFLKTYGLQLFHGNKILEVKNPSINKGAGIQRWLKRPHDFVLCIGDDFTDEDMFAALPPDSFGIKVGRGRTKATYRLASAEQVTALLKQLV